jgi:hypothetical protein
VPIPIASYPAHPGSGGRRMAVSTCTMVRDDYRASMGYPGAFDVRFPSVSERLASVARRAARRDGARLASADPMVDDDERSLEHGRARSRTCLAHCLGR